MTDEGGHGPHDVQDSGEIAPLPEGWVPDPVAREEDPIWQERAAGILAAVDAARVAPVAAPEGGWIAELGGWWRPAALIAAAAAAVLLVADRPTPGSEVAFTDDLTFTLIAGDGDPAALWAALGMEADPVLALIALDGGTP